MEKIYFGRTIWHRRRGTPGFGGWFGTKALSGGGRLIDLGVHRLELEASWMANIKEGELMETRLLGTAGGLIQRKVKEGDEFEAEFYVERAGCQFDTKLHPPVPAVRSAQLGKTVRLN